MEMKSSISNRSHAGEWVLTIILPVLFALAYVWVAFFAADHTKVGNVLFAGLMWIGAILSFYVFVRLCNIHKVTTWSQLGGGPFWTAFTLAVLGVWHIVGGLLIPSVSAQQWFAYAPAAAAGICLFLMFMKWFMEAPRNH